MTVVTTWKESTPAAPSVFVVNWALEQHPVTYGHNEEYHQSNDSLLAMAPRAARRQAMRGNRFMNAVWLGCTLFWVLVALLALTLLMTIFARDQDQPQAAPLTAPNSTGTAATADSTSTAPQPLLRSLAAEQQFERLLDDCQQNRLLLTMGVCAAMHSAAAANADTAGGADWCIASCVDDAHTYTRCSCAELAGSGGACACPDAGAVNVTLDMSRWSDEDRQQQHPDRDGMPPAHFRHSHDDHSKSTDDYDDLFWDEETLADKETFAAGNETLTDTEPLQMCTLLCRVRSDLLGLELLVAVQDECRNLDAAQCDFVALWLLEQMPVPPPTATSQHPVHGGD